MRFVSMYPRLNLGTVVKEQFALVGYTNVGPQGVTGDYHKTVESVSVQFTQEYLTDEDVAFALSYFPESSFRGRYMEGDSVTREPLAPRIGVFDSDLERERQGWDDATLEKVETYIMKMPNYGQDFVKVEKVVGVAGKPWPSYDDTHHFKIPALAAELGLLEESLAYEQANKNRESVISGLEEKLQIPADAVAGEVIAA
jgi:hypothetical protein